MHEVEAWLERKLAPVSRIGSRLGVQPLFAPGEEVAAQASMDALLTDAHWDLAALDATRTRLPQIQDIGHSMVAAQARSIDLVDLARLASFLDFFFAMLPQWQHPLEIAGDIVVDAATRAELRELHDTVRAGHTVDGYSLQAAHNTRITNLRDDLREAQAACDHWREAALANLRALGVTAAHQPEFLVARGAQAQIEHAAVRQNIDISRETPDFFVCTVRYDESAFTILAREQTILRELEEAESALLDAFADQIAQCTVALERAAHWVAVLDVLLARRAFIVRYNLRRAIVNDGTHFFCDDAEYLPLREELGQRYTPLSLEFESLAVLSGANMGGKTSALKAVALVAACVRRGMPVPAQHAEIGLFTQIVWLGDEAVAREIGLSAFGREIAAVRNALGLPAGRCLVLLDEVARTTSPREGRALLIGTLRGLTARGATAVAATHLDHVAERCSAAHFRLAGIDARFLFEPNASPAQLLRSLEDAFDRRFLRVEDEKDQISQAFEVARALGMPADILDYAREEFLQ